MQSLRTTILLATFCLVASVSPTPLEDTVTHHIADSAGVNIHYVSMAEGPLIVLIHHDAADLVNKTLVDWLARHEENTNTRTSAEYQP